MKPTVSGEGYDLYLGHALEVLCELPGGSAHLVVTSPPYWCIKDYGFPEQIGWGQGYEQYIESLQSVLSECHRVLQPGCRAAVNIGDQYLRASEHERYRVQPIPADLTRAGIDLGFDFMGNIIWQKISTTNTTGGCSLMGSMYYPKDGHVTYEHEYILLFRKQGNWPKPTPEQREKSRLTKAQRSKWFRGTWHIQPARQQGHEAQFPLEIPERLIRMYTFWGEVVLDPFVGSGTTMVAAVKCGRQAIGIDGSAEYCELAARSLKAGQRSLFEEAASGRPHRPASVDCLVIRGCDATSG